MNCKSEPRGSRHAAVGVIARARKLHFARSQHMQWHLFRLPPITGDGLRPGYYLAVFPDVER